LCIAGGAVFFVVFVILLIYCIRKKKADRLEDDGKYSKALSSLQPPKILEVLPDSFPVGRSKSSSLARSESQHISCCCQSCFQTYTLNERLFVLKPFCSSYIDKLLLESLVKATCHEH